MTHQRIAPPSPRPNAPLSRLDSEATLAEAEGVHLSSVGAIVERHARYISRSHCGCPRATPDHSARPPRQHRPNGANDMRPGCGRFRSAGATHSRHSSRRVHPREGTHFLQRSWCCSAVLVFSSQPPLTRPATERAYSNPHGVQTYASRPESPACLAAVRCSSAGRRLWCSYIRPPRPGGARCRMNPRQMGEVRVYRVVDVCARVRGVASPVAGKHEAAGGGGAAAAAPAAAAAGSNWAALKQVRTVADARAS